MGAGRKYPPGETRDRMRKWCDLQERAHSDVRKKLVSWGVYGDEAEQIIAELISEDYLNEERFSRAFARGKFRIKRWGWMKIERELRMKGVSAYSLKAAREEYDEEDDGSVLAELLKKKARLITENDPYKLRAKLTRYAVGKGYGFDEIRKATEQMGEE